MDISARDVVMPVVPMFHANCWGLAHSVPMAGAKLVLPGAKMDGASLYELLEAESVTFAAAVPTIWLMLLQHLETTGGEALDAEARRHRRLGRAARHDPEIPRQLRRRGPPRLGHDRDEPARHRLLDEARGRRPRRRGLARRQGEAGPCPLRRRDEDHRRRRPPDALGRQDLRPAEGARARGRARLLPDRRATSSTRRASSTPATSPPSTPRLHADHRPVEGRHQVRRRVDLLDRDREPRHRPSRRRRGGGDRRPPPEMGRAAAAHRRRQAGQDDRRGRASSPS